MLEVDLAVHSKVTMFSVDFETFSSVVGDFGHLRKVNPLLSVSESIHHLEKNWG